MSSILKVNISKQKDFFKEATYMSPGILTDIDYSNLHSLTDFSSGNIKEINITGASRTDLETEFSEIEDKISDCSKRVEHLSETFTYILPDYCGRVWDESLSSPTAKTYCGNLNMLQHLPDILGLGGYLVQNDHSRRKLAADNHYKFPDGSPAKLDGSMGHYQWGWDKPFYITTWTENNLFYECISLSPIPDKESYYVPVGSMSATGFAALDRENDILVSYINNSPRYRGGDNNAEYDDTYRTLLGRPVTSKTVSELISAAKRNGDGWYPGTMRMYSVLIILFHIIMGTRHSQADFNATKNKDGLYECGLGQGISNLFDGNWRVWFNYSGQLPWINLDTNVELGDYTGVSEIYQIIYKNASNVDTTKTYTIPIFFGLKQPFGYLWRQTFDEFAASGEDKKMSHYVLKSLKDDTYIYGLINDSLYKCSEYPSTTTSFIKKLSYDKLEMYPIETGGSDDLYYSDYISYYGSAVDKIVIVCRGGTSYGASYIGITSLFIDNEYFISNPSFTTFLCEFTEDFLLEPVTI